MVQQWKKVSEKTAFANRWRRYDLWDMQREDGQTGEFVIERSRDDVVVFAMTDDRQVLTVREFYFGPGEIAYGLVAGIIENNNPAETAKNELREEAGYVSDQWTYLGSQWKGKYNEGKLHVYIAQSAYPAAMQELEPTEDVEVKLLEMQEFIDLLRAGKVQDTGRVLGAYRALDYLKLL